jgi:hypothetical protein
MRRIATGRIEGLLLAIVAIAVSIWCAGDAVWMTAEFHQALDARPMETTIDLSQLGETTVPFRQTCDISHAEALYLECDLADASQQNAEELLKDLSASIIIHDSDGKEIARADINNRTAHYSDSTIILTRFAPFRNGDYIATIRIESGAPALANKQQTIYAKYQLCGLEQMPAILAAAFAFAAGLIGLVTAVCVWPGLRRCGIWRDVPTDNT